MKVKAIKSWWCDKREKWITPGYTFETDFGQAYLDAGLVVPVRKREIETAIRKAPETQVTR